MFAVIAVSCAAILSLNAQDCDPTSAASDEKSTKLSVRDLHVRIFRLAYINPQIISAATGPSLLGHLEKLKGPDGTIKFEQGSNVIVVRDTLANLVEMQLMVDKLDQKPATSSPAASAAIDSLISLEAKQRPLKEVLAFLSTASGLAIVAPVNLEKLLVTVNLKEQTWRDILGIVATKYGLTVDHSKIKSNVVLVYALNVTNVVNNADVRDVISEIAIQSDVNFVIAADVEGQVTLRMQNVPWREALSTVAKTNNLAITEEDGGILRISKNRKASDLNFPRP